MPDRPNEKEIPMAMLALVGAAIHASLTEWQHGVYKPTSFSADSYLDAYNEHIVLLQGIKDTNVRAYHTIMHRLYTAASGSTAPAGPAAAGNPLAHVDFAGMDLD
ncbi:hypothetical protein C8Q76DRAFT_696627 [Earliella scabrosa]|nr:hypothetical protein C8Q76DRAFT_696627 [Earliella scabrosa]